jgi:hypothetical protein
MDRLVHWLNAIADAAREAEAALGEDTGGTRWSVQQTFGTAKGQLAIAVAELMNTWIELARDPGIVRESLRPTTAPSGRLVKLMQRIISYATGEVCPGGVKWYAEKAVGYMSKIKELDDSFSKLRDLELDLQEYNRIAPDYHRELERIRSLLKTL